MMTRFPSGVWAIVLIVSVLVNGAILGGVLAMTLAGRAIGPARPEIVAAPALREFGARLPDNVRQDVMVWMRESAQNAAPLVEEARDANAAAMQALAAEPFDPESARAAFERAEAARSALEMRAHEATISLFSSLPQESRQNLVRRLGGEQRFILRRYDDRDDDWRRFNSMGGGGRDGRFGDPDRRAPQTAPFSGDQEGQAASD